ncbi:hypothetical protein BKA56DRAFT_679477 [Ilyonectria sp. MPI-CAGE-AT-0026]|nr:hypothetical protein BKA56DRAFT_679477 [Ilyonectria sp. MPI-CAGE-AT-0026]
MAVSPTIHYGTEFLDDSLWYPSDEASPSVQSCRVQTPQLSVETTSCSIDKICPLIENSEKAKVFAAMALNLFVFDGKLHHSRNNWACPFGHCKNNFPDAQTLMRHVLDCPQFSSDKVYCNCCNKDDCFADQSQNDGFCSAEDKTTPCNDKGSPMKAKTMRKLTNITGFFTRSRPASRCSSRGLEHPVSPTSTTARRQSVFSVMTPMPRPSSAPRKPPVVSSPEPSGRPAGSPVDPCHEMDAVSSAVFEVPGTGVIRAQELPASENCSGAGPSSKRSDSGFSELSGLSIDGATAPMFADMGAMTESPTEDLSIDARIPSWDVLQEASAASSRQVSHEMSTSHFPFPSASAHPPVSQHRSEQRRQSSWTLMQQPLRQPAVPLSSQSAQCGMYATDGIPTSDHASFAMLNQNSGFQPTITFLSHQFFYCFGSEMPSSNEVNTQTSSASAARTFTKEHLDQLLRTSNLDNYLQHQANFEKVVIGVPTTPKDMDRYCTVWQTGFDASKK